ncbi:MAG: hypothetical protein LBH46_02190 [Rickettsiales bacterium]|jgi:hypothetical protein|nr:hypothetical protein [Rickettsiales bacterium]
MNNLLLRVRNFFFRIAFLLLSLVVFVCAKMKNKVTILTRGECTNFNNMLFVWGLFPAIFVLFYLQRRLNYNKDTFFAVLLELLVLIYFVWHVYVINKTLSIQPQHKVIKLSEKELLKDKTNEEIREFKKQKRKDLVNRILLKKSWSDTPNYSIIRLIDIFIIMIEIQAVLRYIGVL